MKREELYQLLADYDIAQAFNIQNYMLSDNEAYIENMDVNRRDLFKKIITLINKFELI